MERSVIIYNFCGVSVSVSRLLKTFYDAKFDAGDQPSDTFRLCNFASEELGPLSDSSLVLK